MIIQKFRYNAIKEKKEMIVLATNNKGKVKEIKEI